MGEKTAIEWCDHTFNPWVGCTKLSRACDHCYAEGWAKRAGTPELWTGERRRTSPSNWQQPHKWNRAAVAEGQRARVFCASLADVFDNQVPDIWRSDLFALIEDTPHLDWLLLTKRPQNIAKMIWPKWDAGLPRNIWLGTTIESPEEDRKRTDHLRAIPAAVRFLSMEPLLERTLPNLDGIHWVITGGESGSGARPSHPDWFRALRDHCEAAGVPFLFKQHGDWKGLQPSAGTWPTDTGSMIRLTVDGRRADEGWPMQRVGKKHAGRILDGRTHDEFPSPQSPLLPDEAVVTTGERT
jgi:protein gp37